MARQTGIIKISGRLDDLSFYQGPGRNGRRENFVRTKGGVDADTIASSPNFARTRENMEEFGRAANNGKLVRIALNGPLQGINNSRLASQLTQRMRRIISQDDVNARGKREVLPANIGDMLEFDFNKRVKLSNTFFKKATIQANAADVQMSIPEFIPITDIVTPQGATHGKFKFAAVVLDFPAEAFTVEVAESPEFLVAAAQPQAAQVYNLPIAAGSEGRAVLGTMSIEFFQEVNGVMYLLKNGSYNPMDVVFAQAWGQPADPGSNDPGNNEGEGN